MPEIVVTAFLNRLKFRRATGNELRGKELPEGRIVLPPAEFRELDERLGLVADRVAGLPLQLATCITAIQDQPRDALGMGDRISHGNRRPLRYTEQHETLGAARIDHSVEVVQPGFEGNLRDLAIG